MKKNAVNRVWSPQGLPSGTFSRAEADRPADAASVARAHNAQSAWAAAAAAIEMVAIALATYVAFIAYNLFSYGSIPAIPHYGWASVALAAIYGGLCLSDNQYDLLGAEWDHHATSRGLGAVGLAFVLLLAIGFITDTIGDYSRGTFLTQFSAAAFAQIAMRTILWRVIDDVRTRERWRAGGLVMLALPGANADFYERLPVSRKDVLRAYEIAPARTAQASARARFDAQIAQIQQECRKLKACSVLVAFDADCIDQVNRIISAFSELPVRIQLFPVGLADSMQGGRIASCGHTRVLEVSSRPRSMQDRILKRAIDLLGAIAAGIVALPLLAAVAILIKLDSPGPVFFRQMRHGFNDEPIGVLKFRTMMTLENGVDHFKQAAPNDPRVTRVGRFLRRTNIDELPQLLNVIKGEMSLVGPRPHAIAHNEMFRSQIGRLSRRHNVKPGITGWAQVNGFRGETDTIEKMRKRVEYDLYYVDNWSVMFDVKILIMTVLSPRAYANAC